MAAIPSSLLRSASPILRSWELHRFTLKGGRFHRAFVQPSFAQPLAAQENCWGLISTTFFNRDIKYGSRSHDFHVRSFCAGRSQGPPNRKHGSFPKFENGNLIWERSKPLDKYGSAYYLCIVEGNCDEEAQARTKVRVNYTVYDTTRKDWEKHPREGPKLPLFCLGNEKYDFEIGMYGMKRQETRRMAIRRDNCIIPKKISDWKVYDVTLADIP